VGQGDLQEGRGRRSPGGAAVGARERRSVKQGAFVFFAPLRLRRGGHVITSGKKNLASGSTL
jgi:hypothetical protein